MSVDSLQEASAAEVVFRAAPDPSAAAVVGRQAIEGTVACPSRTVIHAAGRIVGRLDQRWGSVAEVADLAALTVDVRRALPPGSAA